MEQYNVTGMSCAACSARVEKAVSAVEGVSACSVSLLTNSMGVEGTAAPEAIIAAVEAAGYGASRKGEKKTSSPAADEEALRDRETPVLKRRLASSLGFLLVLMYVSMGHTMLGLPLPAFFEGNHLAIGLLELLLAAIVMLINHKFFTSGIRGLLHRAPNMDTLVALGSGVSFLYSTVTLFAMTAAVQRGDAERAHALMHNLYFESAAMIVTLITVGKMLEARSKGKTTDALKSLMRLAPQTARVERGGAEKTVPIDEVQKGDVFLVRPGESIPVDKVPGDTVFSGTINQFGTFTMRADAVSENSSLQRMVRLTEEAEENKAPIVTAADRWATWLVVIALSCAVITWIVTGQFMRAVTVLVVFCPCAFILATPTAVLAGQGISVSVDCQTSRCQIKLNT